MIFNIDDELIFPDPRLGEEGGMFAIGGDLSVDRLLLAYRHGIFPWFSFRDWPAPVWYCPMERFVILPGDIHISHSMHTLMNKRLYRVSFDEDFDGVIHGCGEVNGRYNQEGAWLGEEIVKAYTELHRLGNARSVEVWDMENNLVGGLYGIVTGGCFIGESMFSRVPSASKLALIRLAQVMELEGGKMIDCQLHTDHLQSMGAHFISYEEYLGLLNPGALERLNANPTIIDDELQGWFGGIVPQPS